MKTTKKLTTKIFIKRSIEKHGVFYDYSKVSYTNSKTKVTIICPIHGEFQQIPNSHTIGAGCTKCGFYKNTNKKTTDQFIKSAESLHGKKYDYSKVNYIHSKKPIIIICSIHGEFQQTPNGHLRCGGCGKCGYLAEGLRKRTTIDDFIKKSNKIHNNKYEYNSSIFTRTTDKLDILCKLHGIFTQNAANHLAGAGCYKCSSTISKPEENIKKILDDLGIMYIHQNRKLIPPYEIDFVIPSLKMAIEFNGLYYHSDNFGGKGRKYHLNKTERCEQKGYQLLHIFENEYISKYNILKFKLKSILGKNKYKIFARKCVVKPITFSQKLKFNNKYHIQGDASSCINIGLFKGSRLVQVMTFSKRRISLGSYHRDGEYELSRISSIKGFNIIGGASKLLNYFEKTHNPKKLISYADKRWSKGDVYQKLGFNFVKTTAPNYWYFDTKKPHRLLYHRYKFAKHTLHKRLEIFDPLLSEWSNMKNNKYDRIWDSGNLYFEKLY